MISKQLIILTRTPLHVGAGSSVGAIDQPVMRERHTGFPIIPGSALKHWDAHQKGDRGGKEGGDLLSKLPAMVVNNGLLATLAFCGEADLTLAMVRHLAHGEIGRLDAKAQTVKAALDELSGPNSNSLHLQMATQEALAFLNYLKRLAPPKEK
ncbi:MAG: hypothetical protein HY360_12380 [Verrucomicrobia bacterium]|nr:hypothetical protein [Verrucomicrobiota bacterium]